MRCRLVGRDFKVKGEEEREDLFAAMPPLESKKLMFRMVAAVRGAAEEKGARGGEADVYRREEGPFKCEVRGRRVGRVASGVLEVWEVRQAAEMALRSEKSSRRMGGGIHGEVGR